MISFKNFSRYLFLSIFEFMLVGLNYLEATSLRQVEEQKKTEIQLQKIEEEWKEAERKHLKATVLFQVADKELETVLKKQFEVRSLRQEANRNLELAQKDKLEKRERFIFYQMYGSMNSRMILEAWYITSHKECQLMEKKWKLANESVSVANANQLVALEKFKIADRRLSIAQIQYELVAVKVLCETEGATYMSNIIHSYLVDFDKNEIK